MCSTMNEEIDESEFYHQDFTTASEWEIFIARLEEIIHEWKVEDNKNEELATDSSSDVWNIRNETIQFADVEFLLYYYKNSCVNKVCVDEDLNVNKPKNPIDTNYDFVLHDVNVMSLEYSIALWYGLNEYIVLVPASNTGVTSESQIKVLISSINIAISNTSCEIPIFIQVREKWQRVYLGVYEGDGIRTNFEMVHLRKGPQHCQYLTGLLDMFKTKIVSPVPLDPISVSVQLTYNLTDFVNATWKQELHDVDHQNFDSSSLCVLPFGVTVDPISNIILKASWSDLPDHLIVDSENYSDFDPLQAPKWTLCVKMDDQPVCILSDCITEFLHLHNNHSTMYDVLGDFASVPDLDTHNPLDLLTESPVPTFSAVIKRAARNSLTKSRRGTAPLSEDILVPMLYFLFPDAEDEPMYPYPEKNTKDNTDDASLASGFNLEYQCRGFKTCSMDSLVWRLSIILAQALHTLGGVRAFAHVWFEFVQEMRYRWEKSIPIAGLSPGFPDPRTCLLHQKLQMLNCCIERKKAREARESQGKSATPLDESVGDSSTDDEEFFDCSNKPEVEEVPKRKSKHSLWNQPVGRLGKFGDLRLLKTGDPLYIPVTQDPVPKTEDQLEEDTDVLLKLGSDAQGSELRAKMMSAALLSDMESFKAANPGSDLGDFIRWYSPRDWIEDEGVDEWGQKCGHLSSRMLISNNPWVQVWESAKPVPANRQKRLFDDTREAEKVLHFMDARTLSQITETLLPVLSHAAISRLSDECEPVTLEIPQSGAALRQIVKSVEKLSREGRISTRRYENLIQEMTALELSVSQANSLLYKFNPSGTSDEKLTTFVSNLVLGREVEVEERANSNTGNRIMTMFSDAQKAANMILAEQSSQDNKNPMGSHAFPQATEREFVMRVDAARPAAYSSRCPQFLRAILSRNEFRLVGAFSEDTVFF